MSGFRLSFSNALRGISTLIGTQRNARVHLIATLLVLVLGIALGLDTVEWSLIAIAVSMVWAAEAMNSALEFLADHTESEWQPLVMRAKDVAAGAVLLTSIGALLVGCLVFLPKLL